MLISTADLLFGNQQPKLERQQVENVLILESEMRIQVLALSFNSCVTSSKSCNLSGCQKNGGNDICLSHLKGFL